MTPPRTPTRIATVNAVDFKSVLGVTQDRALMGEMTKILRRETPSCYVVPVTHVERPAIRLPGGGVIFADTMDARAVEAAIRACDIAGGGWSRTACALHALLGLLRGWGIE